MPVVVASRCAEGRTAVAYGADSGGATPKQAGVIFAGTLSAIKSRLMLRTLLGAGAAMDEIRAAFASKNY